LKNADAIVREELDAYNERLFQGTGDERNSEHCLLAVLRCAARHQVRRRHGRRAHLRSGRSSSGPWSPADAMTADWAKLPYDVLGEHLAPHRRRGATA
jgi:GMP synthase (glutamine-hydrolysing)